MALYEERLAKDIGRIRSNVATLGAAVERALADAVQASLTGDRKTANETVLGDHAINRQANEVNRQSYAFLAVHQPGAGHLRQIASILRMASELERIGDYAVTIAREALQLPHAPTGLILDELKAMATQAQESLERAMAAFNDKNADLARETWTTASQGKSRGDMMFDDLIGESENQREQIRYLFDMLIIIGRLKRVSDRARNICEETLFTITGESKPKKTYRVMFLDEANNCQSQIAEAVARRTYPDNGEYSSAGKTNGADLAPGLLDFMQSKGLVHGAVTPNKLDPSVDKASTYDIIVSLQGPISDYLPEQPFRTVFLEWDVGTAPSGGEATEELYSGMYREISARVRDLMETVTGDEAD